MRGTVKDTLIAIPNSQSFPRWVLCYRRSGRATVLTGQEYKPAFLAVGSCFYEPVSR